MQFQRKICQKVDCYLPFVARNYRLLRDYWIFYSYKPYMTQWGFNLYGDPHFDISRTETGEIEIFRKFLTPETVLIDVGANVGLFSCYASTLGCHVIAVEPNPLNFKLLCRNLYQNNLKNVEVFCIALSDTCEIRPLYGGGQGASLLKGWGDMQSTYSNLIPVTTLDHIAASKSNRPLFIKIDVEGNEYYVLAGSTETLIRKDCVWMVENCLTENFEDKNPHFRDVFDVFWLNGYKCYSIALRKMINSSDVDEWIHQGSTGDENINFLFFRLENHKLFV